MRITVLEDDKKVIKVNSGRQGVPGVVDYDAVVKLDQSSEQDIINGIPRVLTVPTDNKHIVNKEYVDANFQRVSAETEIIFVE